MLGCQQNKKKQCNQMKQKLTKKNDYYTTRKVKYILFIGKLIILLKTPAHIDIKMKYIKQEI